MRQKLILPVIIGLSSLFVSAQTAEKGKIGLTYSLNGGTSVIQPALLGAASHEISSANAIGLIYLKPINNWLEWETGLTYTLYKVTTPHRRCPKLLPEIQQFP